MAVRAATWFHVGFQAPPPLPANFALNVVPVGQGNMDNWCWAACIKMALEQQGAPSLTLPDIVRKEYPKCSPTSSCNNPCPPNDVAGVFQACGLTLALESGPVGLDVLQDQVGRLKNGVGVGWDGNPQHMVLVFGYTSDSKVQIVDPAGNGSVGALTMLELASPVSNGTNNRFWKWSWLNLRR